MSKGFLITTPIYYVNAQPHIGHAYTTIVADVLTRFHRINQDEVFFLTGTDEHGQKVERAAREAGLEPQEFADRMIVNFKQLWEMLGITYNDFIRTTEARHISCVQRVLEILYKKKDIYLEKYEGCR